jgi:hypothetical protein
MTIFEDRNSTGSGGRSCPSDLSGSVGIGIGEVFELEAVRGSVTSGDEGSLLGKLADVHQYTRQ